MSRRFSSARTAQVRTAVLCGLLAVTGGRKGRKAAARGALSAALAVYGSRLVARAVGVRAEDIVRLPGPRTMSSWALAAGASLEMPRSGVPLATLAVGLSAVEARAQRSIASPVAGAVVGAAAAMITRQWWPLSPLSPSRTRRFHLQASVPPSPRGAGVVITVNPAAGPKRAESPAQTLRNGLPDAHVEEVQAGGDLTAALRRAGQAARAVGVAGGDGSLNAGVGVASDRDLPFVAVPAGTLNHFARDLGVGSVDDVIEAVQRGEVVAVDVGLINGRPFLNQANIGGYVELVDVRRRMERRIGKWPAAAVALVRVLVNSRRMVVEIDGERRRIWMAFIGNCHYVPNGIVPALRQRMEDGVLDVRLVGADRSWSRTRLVFATLTGRVERSSLYDQRLVRTLRLRVLEPSSVRIGIDGETFEGSVDLAAEKRPRPLLVYAPHG